MKDWDLSPSRALALTGRVLPDRLRGHMQKRAQVFYTGRVQGVGFRYTAREVACGYDVAGFVRNLVDGRVELLAEGEEAEVAAFLEGIRESQLGSHIRNAAVNWGDATREYKGFEIRD